MIFGPPNQEPRLEDLSFLLGHTYDPQTCMSEAHLRPSQLDLRPFKITPTTLKPACQSPPTTLTAPPTTLQGHTYDPQTRMSGAHLRPSQLHLRPFKVTPTTLKPACQEATTTLFALWPNTKVLPQSA